MKNKLYRINKQNKLKKIIEIIKTYSFIFSIGFGVVFSYLNEKRKQKGNLNLIKKSNLVNNTKYATINH